MRAVRDGLSDPKMDAFLLGVSKIGEEFDK